MTCVIESAAEDLMSAQSSSYVHAGESQYFTIKLTLGCTMAIAGFCLYSSCRLAGSAGGAQACAAASPCIEAEEAVGSVKSDQKHANMQASPVSLEVTC